jgi:hypothetical protein
MTQLATSAAPLCWSANSSVLLLDVNGNDPSAPTTSSTEATAIYAPLAYWQPDMKDPVGIRINLTDGSFAAAAIP